MAAVVGSMLQRSSRSNSNTANGGASTSGSPSNRNRTSSIDTSENHFNSDSARKRRKYIPGGPGGGGRFIDIGAGSGSVAAATSSSALTPPPVPSLLQLATATGDTSRLRMAARTTPRRSHRPERRSSAAAAASPMRAMTLPRQRRERRPDTPTYDSAAEAAAAAVQGDGYKPREERSWEEFHPDLDLDVKLDVFSAAEVDGVNGLKGEAANPTPDSPAQQLQNGATTDTDIISPVAYNHISMLPITPQPKKRGRPPRRPESMLSGLGSPPAQRIVPLPAQNPKERLTLPKPSYRKVETFTAYEMEKGVSQNYVDQAMANVGYQKNDLYQMPEKQFIRLIQNSFGDNTEDSIYLEADKTSSDDPPPPASTIGQVEYDMDEQDQQWLDAHNAARKTEGADAIKAQIFEITMTQIEKEWHALEKRIPKPNPKPPQTQRPRSSSAAAVNGETAAAGEEQDSKCAVCDDGDCENTNAIVFCDGCDLAVHQECYGVPFIPEGQWLCRKCQLVGRATPTCVFCPNTDGAFKRTHEARWAHLICAIWIPEVTLANTTFMEPIMDVANIPRQRWRLNCYICHQRMGACIQCGNRNCFQAFHVTCARRARLYLKMKSSHGGPATFDASILKAFCDKHVPLEWRREHDVERATAEAKAFYRREMKGRKWADSQQSALALVPAQQNFQPIESIETTAMTDENSAAQKKKREQAQKNVWRLPSGAPIVPNVVWSNVEVALQRFTLRKRKEFVAEACKYWTLKREARRGAALLKRLQLQLETFSTMEIARRNFAGLGAAGGPKLQRRIEFAEQLEQQMAALVAMCEQIVKRESLKLRDAEMLRDTIDTVYFPITPLLWPVLRKAQSLDTAHNIFAEPFRVLQDKLNNRMYTSVAAFSADLGSIFRSIVGLDSVNDAVEVHNQLLGVSLKDSALTNDQKELKKLAKRIVKAVQQPLQDALRSEAELAGKPFERELHRLDAMLGEGFDASLYEQTELETSVSKDVLQSLETDDAEMTDQVLATAEGAGDVSILNEVQEQDMDTEMLDVPQTSGALPADGSENVDVEANLHGTANVKDEQLPAPESSHMTYRTKAIPPLPPTVNGPLTPPASEKDLLAPLSQGGIPWYVEPFDPIGTTIQDERWTGRDVLRSLSEELSEIDEEELKGLGANVRNTNDTLLKETAVQTEAAEGVIEHVVESPKKTPSAARKRKKRKNW